MKASLAVLILISTAVILPNPARSQWMFDGTPLSPAGINPQYPMVASDDAGGAIVVWQDTRNGDVDIYAQRIDASGTVRWATDGVALCSAVNNQSSPTIVADGSGGGIVTWYDFRNSTISDIYAQRVSATGVVQWAANGVLICNAANYQYNPIIASDGAGGAIVTWYDNRAPATAYDIYAQRINASGVVQWAANGLALCTSLYDQYNPMIVSDGAGGAIVAWYDYRNGGPLGSTDIYAQRVSASGAIQWPNNGLSLSTASGDQRNPTIASDGAGGAIVTWHDLRSGNNDIYAQRITAAGGLWAVDGVPLCVAAGNQTFPTIVSDGTGGAIVTWEDLRSGTYDIYTQRVDASGVVQWAANGVALCSGTNDQRKPTIAPDGANGAIATWYDNRSGTYDIYAQRISASGQVQWTANGAPVCTAANDQQNPTIVSDGAGVIVAWNDYRNGSRYVAYAQRVESNYGYWGHPEPLVTSVADVRGDQGGQVKVNWKASDWDVFNLRTITHYSVWRATESVAAVTAAIAANPKLLVEPSEVCPAFEGPAYRIEHGLATDYYWEWVGDQSAEYFKGYRYSAATSADSTAQGAANHFFQVLSHTSDPFTFWVSNAMSGHSVDNLAPPAPLYLTAQRSGANVNLKWNRVRVTDLKNYSVYRKTAAGVTPVSVNFLTDAADTVLVDANTPTTTLYYIVTANDVHANQGPASNEASVQATTGAGNLPPVTALTVLQNHPNPFTATTELQVGLPSPGAMTIDVYDVAGRRVRELRVAGEKGWQRIALAGVDERGRPLASGVYFYKVRSSGETITRKMVIAR